MLSKASKLGSANDSTDLSRKSTHKIFRELLIFRSSSVKKFNNLGKMTNNETRLFNALLRLKLMSLWTSFEQTFLCLTLAVIITLNVLNVVANPETNPKPESFLAYLLECWRDLNAANLPQITFDLFFEQSQQGLKFKAQKHRTRNLKLVRSLRTFPPIYVFLKNK